MRARSSAASRAAAIAAVGLAVGCSATRLDYTKCELNAQCRAEFGFGFVCDPDGLCEESERLNRCNSVYPEDLFNAPEEHANAIVFGNLMDRSLATHRAREQSARLAIKQANEAGGLELRELGIVFCTIEEDTEFDFLSRPEAAEASAEYLIGTLGVPAIIGPASSDDTKFVFDNQKDTGTLFISPSATSTELTDIDNPEPTDDAPGLLWRTAPPDSLQGAAIAYDMRRVGNGRTKIVDNVAVIYHEGAYGGALSSVFSEAFTAAGGTVTMLKFQKAGEIGDQVATAAAGDYDEVLFVSGQTTEAIGFMDSAAGLMGFDTKTIFLTDGAANADLLAQADPKRFPQVRGTRQAPRDEMKDLVYASFVASYASEYGESPSAYSFTANAYDAAWLVSYGAAWSLFQDGDISGLGIAKGLRHVSSGDHVEMRPGSWNTVVESFRDATPVNVSGASGDLDYDPATEETSGKIEIWVIEGDSITGVDTWTPDS